MEDVSVGHQKMKREQDSLLTFDFQISAAAAQGGRRYMEDRLQIEVGRAPNGELDFIFAAVYDGHGGVQASDYAYTHLFQHIVNNQAFFSNDDNEVLEAIRSGFLRTQLDMHKAAEQWPPTSTGFPCTAGTTATCAIIRNGKLYTGHVGDSSIILANFMEEEAGYTDGKLTEDHKPESKAERIRIEKAGGAIASKSGIFRVVWKRPMRGHRGPIRRSTLTENIPFLAVARSLGDFWSLNPDNNQYVISPDPDVDVFRLKNTDNFIIIASDGLTNVLTVSSIIGILRDEKKAASSPFSDGANKVMNEQQNYQLNYAHSLLQSSLEKWGSLRADNISIICIKLNADEIPEKHPSIAEEHAGGMDIGQQLIDHPCSIIHVNQTRTFRLMAPFIRTGVKRRLQESEDEDGYIRHIPTSSNDALILDVPSASSSSSFSPSKKLCRKEEHQEDEEEAFLKPPPAKRSKLQSVFNFFTNLFK